MCSEIYYGSKGVQVIYNYETDATNTEQMNPRGDNAIYIYHNICQTNYSFVYPPKNEDEQYELTEIKEMEFQKIIGHWAKYILGWDSTHKTSSKGISSYELRMNKHLITNVGFGSSQLFPILLEGIRQKNGLLLLEQPEIHLHPNAQARLVDFFIAFKYNNLKLVIETHSVHMINRMVRRMVEDSFVHDNVETLFINVKKHDSKIKSLHYDQFGVVEEWPDDFLNQTGHKEARRFYRAQKKKMLELEE